MAVPKRKKSKSKIRMRRNVRKMKKSTVKACPQCGAAQESHRICPSCGYYKGRQVLSVETV